MHTKTSYSGWPYPAVHAISSSGSQLGNFTKTSALSTNSPTLRAASYSRQSGYDLGTAGQQNAFTRTQYPLTYNINYEEDPSAMFNIQSPAYMLPNANSSVMVSYCAALGSPKAWRPVPDTNKIQNGGPYSDQDSASPMGQPAYPYITPSSHVPPPSTDIPSLFPAITSLSSSCQGSDRTLPNPTSRCQVLSSPPTSLTTLPESLSLSGLSFSPGQSYKAGNHWGPKSTSSTSSEASTGTMSSSSGGSSASSVNGTKTVSSSAQDMVFGYITSSSSPPSLSSNTYRGADMVDPADGFQTGTDSGLTRTMSRESESLLSLGGCSPSIYGYSTGEKSKRRSDGANSGSSGTLMNGLPYIRLPQSEHHNPSPFNILQSDAVTDAHRTSISSLSNPGGY